MARLFEPVDIASLAFFRIVFGICLIFHIWPHATGFSAFFGASAPAPHFSYPFLDWIPPVSRQSMALILQAMLAASVGITLGFAYRLSILTYALGAAYFHFMDASKFHNHYYLIVLVTTLLAFMPANGAASVDALIFRKLRRSTTPRWTLLLLRFQFVVPYFFSGLSKLNGEWLSGFPAIFHWGSFVMAHEWADAFNPVLMARFIAWAGALSDFSMFPLLLWRRTRPFGIGLALLFNVGNAILFSGPIFRVAMFPWIMIAGVTLFLDPDWPRRMGNRLRRRASGPGPAPAHASPSPPPRFTPLRGMGVAVLALYVLIQVAMPLRYRLYPGHALWTEFGRTHAWQMMSSHKIARTTYLVTDPATGETTEHHLFGAMAGPRYYYIQRVPALIYQYAVILKERMAANGRPDCEVRVDSFVRLNGRAEQRFIDPEIDIAASPPRWGYVPWVLPLEESLPELRDVRTVWSSESAAAD